MSIPAFTNITLFPSFSTCPETTAPAPAEDWFLLAQVKDDMTITKPTLVLSDRDSSPFALVFDGLERDDLDLKKLGLKKGNTAVIPRAKKTPPKDDTKRGFVSVEKGRAAEVKVIPGPLDKVFTVGAWLRERESSGAEPVCETCGKEGELMKCTGCGRVKYCGKECQLKGWTEKHKGECKIVKGISEIWR
ncbi:hypothetical protein OQA88_6457 [Cercophora sp. LCS_1]